MTYFSKLFFFTYLWNISEISAVALRKKSFGTPCSLSCWTSKNPCLFLHHVEFLHTCRTYFILEVETKKYFYLLAIIVEVLDIIESSYRYKQWKEIIFFLLLVSMLPLLVVLKIFMIPTQNANWDDFLIA